MAGKNDSNEFGRFQEEAEEIIARLQKNHAEEIRKIPENDLYQRSQAEAEIRGLEAISRAKEWIYHVLKNAHENESYDNANKRLENEINAKEVARVMQIPYPITLPEYPEGMRALPNGMLRSSLFGAIGRGRRRAVEQKLINSINGVEIKYTGWLLDQSDLDVYETVLHALRFDAMGERCRITTYKLLKIMEKKNTGGNIKVLYSSLMRLRANAVEITQGQYTYIGGLLDGVLRDRKTKELIITLNPTLRLLYEPDQFTLVDWKVRKLLNSQSLAQWLHAFYSTHAEPHPMKIESLLKLAGSENINPRSSHQKLKKALDAVVEAFKAAGQDFSYEIKNNLVYVKIQPSKSQQRYLDRKKHN